MRDDRTFNITLLFGCVVGTFIGYRMGGVLTAIDGTFIGFAAGAICAAVIAELTYLLLPADTAIIRLLKGFLPLVLLAALLVLAVKYWGVRL